MALATLEKKNEIKRLWKRQESLSSEVRELRAKMRLLGSLRRFENIASRGRAFARARGLKPADALRDD